MTFSLGEAAKEVGKSKTTLTRAIKSGRLSAHRREDGSYQIDPAELFRVYERRIVHPPETGTPPVASSSNGAAHHDDATRYTATDTTGTDGSRTKAAEWRQVVIKQEERIEEQARTIEDLRSRLNQADDDRRAADARADRATTTVMALLEHDADRKVRRWWPWLWLRDFDGSPKSASPKT